MGCRTFGIILAVVLVGQCSARRLDHEDGEGKLRSPDGETRKSASQDIPVASEVHDLMNAGNSPTKRTKTKNVSGKSDKGGYYKTYGSDAEGEKGYLNESYSKGDHGYKTLDTFHKQDGDKYGFEEYTAYGKARAGKKGGGQGESGSYSNKRGDGNDHEGAGTVVDGRHYNSDGSDGGESAHYSNEYEAQSAPHDHGTGSYGYGDDHAENYSAESGDEGSYGSHSSYTHASDVDGNYEGGYY